MFFILATKPNPHSPIPTRKFFPSPMIRLVYFQLTILSSFLPDSQWGESGNSAWGTGIWAKNSSPCTTVYVVLYYLMDLVCISLTLICLTKVKVDLVILSHITQKILCVTFFEKICVPVKRTYTYIHSSLLVAAT